MAFATAGETETTIARQGFSGSPVATALADSGGRIQLANRAFCRQLAAADDDLTGTNLADLLHPMDATAVITTLQQAPRGGRGIDSSFDVEVRRCDGTVFPGWCQIGATTTPDSGLFVVTIQDMSHRQAAQSRLAREVAFRSAMLEMHNLTYTHGADDVFYRKLLARMIEVVEGAEAGSILVRSDGTDRYEFVAAQGFDLEQLQRAYLQEDELFRGVHEPVAMIVHGADNTDIPPERADILAKAGRSAEIEASVSVPVLLEGEPIALVSLDNFQDPDAFDSTSVQMATMFGQNIADVASRRTLQQDLVQQKEAFRHLAHHDQLTGLANRRSLDEALKRALSEARRHDRNVALLFIDLDDFKQINDTHGHDVGDVVLVRVADVLRDSIRQEDIALRWGGDEFVVLLRDIESAEMTQRTADRILTKLHDSSALVGGEVRCGASIGAAYSHRGEATPQELLKRADEAVYEAKVNGKERAHLHRL